MSASLSNDGGSAFDAIRQAARLAVAVVGRDRVPEAVSALVGKWVSPAGVDVIANIVLGLAS